MKVGDKMKKTTNIIVLIILIIFFLIILDFTHIYLKRTPFLYLKKDNNQYTGLIYNVYTCPGYKKVIIKSKFTKYNCPNITNQAIDLNNINIKVISDNDNLVHLKGLININQDTEYSLYYLGSNKITINEEELSKLLLSKTITPEDLTNKMNIIKKDNNYTLYEYPDNNFRILTCTINNSKRVYLGFKELKENICQ